MDAAAMHPAGTDSATGTGSAAATSTGGRIIQCGETDDHSRQREDQQTFHDTSPFCRRKDPALPSVAPQFRRDNWDLP
jgi:hypothetical protein